MARGSVIIEGVGGMRIMADLGKRDSDGAGKLVLDNDEKKREK